MKWALVLSGGGLRGAAHIGVIRALEEAELHPSMVLGVSAGSIVAAMYGTGHTPSQMLSLVHEAKHRYLFDFDWRWVSQAFMGLVHKIQGKPDAEVWPGLPSGILVGRQLEKFLESIWGTKTLDDTSIPTVVTAADLKSGLAICFVPHGFDPLFPLPYRKFVTGVPIAKAVRASCGIPGVFQPVPTGPFQLVDGAVRTNMPTDVARALGAERVVCVNLRDPEQSFGVPGNFVETMLRASEIMGYEMDLCTIREGADLVMEPRVGHIRIFDFERIDEAVKAGYASALSAIPTISRLVEASPDSTVDAETASAPNSAPPKTSGRKDMVINMRSRKKRDPRG